jgi:hypothetical protein
VFNLLGWGALILFPSWALLDQFILVIAGYGLCSIYTLSLLMGSKCDHQPLQGHILTFSGVMKLMALPRMVLPSWIHFFSFDLIAGWYVVHNSQLYDISHWMIIPCLIFGFMLGPLGLLLYLLLRVYVTGEFLLPFM